MRPNVCHKQKQISTGEGHPRNYCPVNQHNSGKNAVFPLCGPFWRGPKRHVSTKTTTSAWTLLFGRFYEYSIDHRLQKVVATVVIIIIIVVDIINWTATQRRWAGVEDRFYFWRGATATRGAPGERIQPCAKWAKFGWISRLIWSDPAGGRPRWKCLVEKSSIRIRGSVFLVQWLFEDFHVFMLMIEHDATMLHSYFFEL